MRRKIDVSICKNKVIKFKDNEENLKIIGTMKIFVDDHITIDKRLMTKELSHSKIFRSNEGSMIEATVELLHASLKEVLVID